MKLEIKNISKQYGKKTVLQGVSQEFSGGVYGLLARTVQEKRHC